MFQNQNVYCCVLPPKPGEALNRSRTTTEIMIADAENHGPDRPDPFLCDVIQILFSIMNHSRSPLKKSVLII